MRKAESPLGLSSSAESARLRSVDRGAPSRAEPPVDVKTFHAKIGELAVENDILERALGKAGLLRGKR